jgi:uncharacterized protein YjdB
MVKRSFISLILINISFILCSQTHPDLGLHGLVTWLSDTKIRVEYDWSNDSQLSDWTVTNGSTIVRGNGIVTVKGGTVSVFSMVWKQPVKCSRIYAQNATAINSSVAHLNFVTNVLGWSGLNYNPPEMIGLIYRAPGNYWLENGTMTSLPGPTIVLGNKYTVDINITGTTITTKSSSDNIVYSYNLSAAPSKERQVAVGGWEGDTEWGKLTIEGEITLPSTTHSDMINIQSNGSQFSPVIEVVGTPEIRWIFDDSTTSTSNTPVKNYGSLGSRHNFLKVTPWSALIGINVGYDAGDSGYGGFAMVPNQNVSGFHNLSLAKSSLQYICASYNPLTELDLRGFTALKFIELLYCQNMAKIRLGTHPVLERLCVEDNNLDSLNISGCPALKDLRSALNNYTTINWGSTGLSIWHICIRDNPKMKVNIPPLTQFPLLKELLNWNSNQTGAFVCHSSVLEIIESYGNRYTSADLSGCTALKEFAFSGNQLASINLGTANNLTYVQLKDCGLIKSQTDYVLNTLDGAGKLNGNLDLSGNMVPSADGLVHYNSLKGKGWTVILPVPVATITVTGAGGISAITTDNGTLQLSASVLPATAGNKTVTWSIVNGTGTATISETGIVTAVDNGTVTARATANDGSDIYGTLVITISNQIISVVNITVTGANGSSVITSEGGTLQLGAVVSPANATINTVTWSVVNGTGQATISQSGLVVASSKGTVTAKATANDGSGVFGSMIISIEAGDPVIVSLNSNEMSVRVPDNLLLAKINLLNINGSVLETKTIESNICIFNVSNLPSGIYVISIYKSTILSTVKVIKPW